jgi:hypothetical protein
VKIRKIEKEGSSQLIANPKTSRYNHPPNAIRRGESPRQSVFATADRPVQAEPLRHDTPPWPIPGPTAIHRVRRGTGLLKINFDSKQPATLESFSRHGERSDRSTDDRLAGCDDLASLGRRTRPGIPHRVSRKPGRARLQPVSGRGRRLSLGWARYAAKNRKDSQKGQDAHNRQVGRR